MTPQGKEIAAILAAAGLRRPRYGATTITYRDGTTRIDWQGRGRQKGLQRCAAALLGAGWDVDSNPTWVCIVVKRPPPQLPLFPEVTN